MIRKNNKPDYSSMDAGALNNILGETLFTMEDNKIRVALKAVEKLQNYAQKENIAVIIPQRRAEMIEKAYKDYIINKYSAEYGVNKRRDTYLNNIFNACIDTILEVKAVINGDEEGYNQAQGKGNII